MPATGTDQDYDGVLDHFSPDGSVGGKEVFNTGFYVWFYMSDSSGIWGHTGTKMWRSIVATNSAPGAGNVDANWSQYYGANFKWNLIDSFSFSVDPLGQTTTFTISASSLARAERSQSTDPTGS